MIAVIADDITGAAEIAGIGFRYGLKIHFVTRLEEHLPDSLPGSLLESDLLVYATDTRSMSVEDAVEKTRRVVRELQSFGIHSLFKKTDSALRGHIIEELRTLLEETTYQQALLLPENPSRGRTIEDGIYYLQGRPLAETDFALDPEFPALTSSVIERFPTAKWVKDYLPISSHPEIFIADAYSVQAIENYVQQCSSTTLLAGAADLFTTYLDSLGYQPVARAPFAGLGMRNALIVCGSTQSISLEMTSFCLRKEIHSSCMPLDVFKGTTSPDYWIESLQKDYRRQGNLLLAIGHPSEGGKSFALRLRNTMSMAVGKLVSTIGRPQELIIEGGATAFSILEALGWLRFEITDEIASGIIRMKSESGTYVTLKPGSYQWGEKLFQ